jgi:hypothetical protein
MIIFFSAAESGIGKRPWNPGLRKYFVSNAEVLLLKAFIHVCVLGFADSKYIEINIKYGEININENLSSSMLS